jgi:hypothetical protein
MSFNSYSKYLAAAMDELDAAYRTMSDKEEPYYTHLKKLMREASVCEDQNKTEQYIETISHILLDSWSTGICPSLNQASDALQRAKKHRK